MFLDRRLTSRASHKQQADEIDGKLVRDHGWFLEFVFRGEELAENSPVAEILDALLNSGLPGSARQNVHTIINELYINALDYGVLKLDASGKQEEQDFYDFADQRQARLDKLLGMEIMPRQWIKIECLIDISDRPALEIIVADSGAGIAQPESSPDQPVDTSTFGGRGLTIVRQLANKVIVQPQSNQIKVLYKC